MKINIKDDKKLKKFANEFNQGPTSFLNDVVDSLTFPPGFKDEARKSSFKTTLFRSLRGSLYTKKLEEEVYSILGKYDYHIEDGDIDLVNRTCWFRMYVSIDEKKIDLDSVHFQLNEGSSALVAVERIMDDISNFDKINNAKIVAIKELDNYFDDPRESELEFHDGYDENSILMELTIEDEDVSYLPKLNEMNNAMDEIEYKFRKALDY